MRVVKYGRKKINACTVAPKPGAWPSTSFSPLSRPQPLVSGRAWPPWGYTQTGVTLAMLKLRDGCS